MRKPVDIEMLVLATSRSIKPALSPNSVSLNKCHRANIMMPGRGNIVHRRENQHANENET